MSEYTLEYETAINPASTIPLTPGDFVGVYSSGVGRFRKATAGSVSSLSIATAATSATTGTNITNYGFTSLGSSSGPITAWLLDVPIASGIRKMLLSISTSTAHTVTTAATATANFLSTDTWLGTTFTFSKAGAYVELQSLSTSQGWLVVGRSPSGVIST